MFGKRNIKKSLNLWDRAIELIPRGTQTMSKAPDQFVFGVHPIFLDRGKGCMVQDVDSNWYIDYPCALGPILLGHNHKRTVKAITKQAKKGITFSLMHPLEVELAEMLTDIIPCAEQVRYGKNGTDATLATVRLARSYTKKEYILKPEGHYHGWGDWNAASTTRSYGVPECMKELIETFPYNDLDALEDKLKTEKFAALIMEPMALESPKKGFLQGVRDLCTQYKTILIFDEVITGFRWALGGAQEYYGVTPDLAAFGKSIANGLPLSIIAGKKEYMKEFDHIFFSMTFGGEACALAAAVETLKELKEREKEIYTHMWEQGTRLRVVFNEYSRMLGIDAEMFGCGPRHNMKFNEPDSSGCRDLFNQEMIKRGVLVSTQFYMTIAHTSRHVDKTVKAIKESLEVVAKALKDDRNNVDKYLEGHRSKAIFKKAVSEADDENK